MARMMAFLLLPLLLACSAVSHFGWERDFARLDDRCVEAALRSVAPTVKRNSYLSNGDRGVPDGAQVTQFYYSDPASNLFYTLDLAPFPNGRTRYIHEFSTIGEISAEKQSEVLPMLRKTNRAVARSCGLSFADSDPELGAG